MRRFGLLAMAACLALSSGCAAPGSEHDPLAAALSTVPSVRADSRLTFLFADIDGIRQTVGYEGALFSDSAGHDAAERWGKLAATVGLNQPALFGPMGRTVPESAVPAWSITALSEEGQRVAIAGLSDEELTQTTDEMRELGWGTDGDYLTPTYGGQLGARIGEGNLYLEPRDSAERMKPDVAINAWENDHVVALRDCLAGSQLVFLLTAADKAYAIVASVDAEGNGKAWSCIHAPSDTQQTADALVPTREDVEITKTTVNGEVIKSDLRITASDTGLPSEAKLIASGPEALAPLF